MSYDLEKTPNGCLIIKGSNTRILVTPVHMIAKTYEELKKVLGPAANVILREIGKGYAESMLEVVRGENGNLSDMITKFMEKVGFGSIRMKKDGDRYLVEIERSPSCDLNMGRCHFEEGVVLGLIQGIEGGKWKVRTLEFDSNKCLIEVTPLQKTSL